MIWYGCGRNGKTTLTDIIATVLDKAFTPLAKEVLTKAGQKQAGAASPHLMPLVGARLGVAAETEAGEQTDSSATKVLTGNNRVVFRQLYGEMEEHRITAKVVVENEQQT